MRSIITSGADKVSGMNGAQFTNEYGYGRINAHASLRLTSLAHPDGTLVQASGDPKIYLIENGERRHVTSRQVFESHNFLWDRVRKAVLKDMDMPVGTPLGFREGTLLQGSGDPVYIVDYDGSIVKKRHITSRVVFDLLGFEWGDIIRVSDSQLPPANGISI